jgi:hypothetical protein
VQVQRYTMSKQSGALPRVHPLGHGRDGAGRELGVFIHVGRRRSGPVRVHRYTMSKQAGSLPLCGYTDTL